MNNKSIEERVREARKEANDLFLKTEVFDYIEFNHLIYNIAKKYELVPELKELSDKENQIYKDEESIDKIMSGMKIKVEKGILSWYYVKNKPEVNPAIKEDVFFRKKLFLEIADYFADKEEKLDDYVSIKREAYNFLLKNEEFKKYVSNSKEKMNGIADEFAREYFDVTFEMQVLLNQIIKFGTYDKKEDKNKRGI